MAFKSLFISISLKGMMGCRSKWDTAPSYIKYVEKPYFE
jgi:hypothetical protein